MNEFKRCMNVFTHSPFKVRLMLLNMLCDMFNAKPQQDDLQPPSQNICLATVDLDSRSHYLLAALHNLRLAEADLHSLSTHCPAGFDP